ncbi:6-phosphogluconolactonase [Litorihabitans aurantiacus]|uniref:Glucosamine-6-phosphate deaminase n=1 Tax=Litorihabitans aurantiacus TaxID=1930061 RepID=A0AA37UHY4_9MICO|nr:6-phosphogluconolactonase [Litorihabitans aurantiacus]GMA31218.1 glucosamine-6-phosphate deaminase [Litorihabitans aurantiacus]
MTLTPTTTHPLHVRTLADADALGEAAALVAADRLRTAVAERGRARLMLAAAPSQSATLRWLVRADGIAWDRVEAFHMDDYVGLDPAAPQGFGTWLHTHLLDHVGMGRFHRIDATRPADEAAAAYREAMGEEEFDVVLCGLGVNGHLAFNDPPADLADPLSARVVELDEVSRQQQVDEGHFPELDAVPPHAVTVTIPRLLHTRTVVASVPTAAKREAVRQTLGEPVSGAHPGTALRTHPDVHLFLDPSSDPDSDPASDPAAA